MPARIDDILVLDQDTSKTAFAKYLRDREHPTPSDFGGIGDGVADDTAAVQACFDRAAADGKIALIPKGIWNVSAGVVLGGAARGLIMHGVLRYTGTAPVTVLTLGDGGAVRNGEKLWTGLDVIRAVQSDWSSEADIGILLRNFDASWIEVRRAQGFTIGVRTLGDGRGCEDSTLHLGRLLDNRIGLDIRTATDTAWNNAIRYIGGHFANSSGVNASSDRFGVRLSAEPGAYINHNHHVFEGPNFELAQSGSNLAVPFLNETSGQAVVARSMRMEACSPLAARHTAGATECLYEIAWATTYGIGIDYPSGATRAGNAVVNRHRAAAARHPRLLAAVPSLRSAAYRESAADIGVESLAVVSTGTTAATTLAGVSFAGLSGITPTASGLLLNANRGLVFVVDVREAKEFALAHWLVGGADGGRLFVRCFDAAKTILTDADARVLASGTTMGWNSAPKAWIAGAGMANASLNRRQSVRVIGGTVAFAQIGIVGFDGAIELEALRLYGLPEAAPAVLAGPAHGWGRREIPFSAAYDPPSLGAGASHQVNVSVPGALPGDAVQVGFSVASTAVLFLGTIGASGTVTVVAWNRAGSTIDLAAGTLFGQVVKPRLV
ncbi:hypothetical protein [Elioraea sp.]|uniref:hypothetical protein n=1 Tax=Elioraea sp. TaxID=2185103 RepID=UPI0021DC33D5|nr:hypothetical protein [Elioraea sp.]GIX10383.1 MAG: hypothetical protein KatS3mg116_2093 [Elioraea sp.]